VCLSGAGYEVNRNDIVAGASAALLFLALYLLVGITPVVSVALAAVAYVGLRLSLPRPDPLATAVSSCERALGETGRLVQALASAKRPNGKQQVRDIYQVLMDILTVIRTDAAKREYAPAFYGDYILPINAVLTPYVRLTAQNVDSATKDLTDIETETLPRIATELKKLKDDIYLPDVANLRTGKELVDLMSLPLVVRYKDDNR
jgi:hypothetical protein